MLTSQISVRTQTSICNRILEFLLLVYLCTCFYFIIQLDSLILSFSVYCYIDLIQVRFSKIFNTSQSPNFS